MPATAGPFLDYPWRTSRRARLAAIRDAMPELGRSHDWCRPPYSAAADRARMLECRRRWQAMTGFEFAVVESGCSRLLGEVGLDRIDYGQGGAELSYWIRRDLRGRGLATTAASILACFAFRELELVQLRIRVAADNPASARVARKLGAELEIPVAHSPRVSDRADEQLFTLRAERCQDLRQRHAQSYLQHSPEAEPY